MLGYPDEIATRTSVLRVDRIESNRAETIGSSHFTTTDSDPESLQAAAELAYKHGQNYDAYLILEAGRHLFFTAQRQGVLSFERWWNCVYVMGGLVAAREHQPELLQQFLAHARQNRWNVSFFNIPPEQAHLFRAAGCEVSKIGEEALIDLRETTWGGKGLAWVRQQENNCLKSGMRFREIHLDRMSEVERSALKTELAAVSQEHISDTVYNRELGMMVGTFDLERLFRKRLFVAECDGQVKAFLVALPSQDGHVWNAETFRKRLTAPRGVIAYMIIQAGRLLQRENIAYLSLGQCPAVRCGEGDQSDSNLVQGSIQFWWSTLNLFYDVHRLYHFKSRFRPQYRECFIAASPKCRVIPIVVFLYKWGIIWPDWLRVPRQTIRRLKKWFHREKLADPGQEVHVRLTELQLTRELSAKADLVPMKASERAVANSVSNGKPHLTLNPQTAVIPLAAE